MCLKCTIFLLLRASFSTKAILQSSWWEVIAVFSLCNSVQPMDLVKSGFIVGVKPNPEGKMHIYLVNLRLWPHGIGVQSKGIL